MISSSTDFLMSQFVILKGYILLAGGYAKSRSEARIRVGAPIGCTPDSRVLCEVEPEGRKAMHPIDQREQGVILIANNMCPFAIPYLDASIFILSMGSPSYCLSLMSLSSNISLIKNPLSLMIFK